MRHGTSGTVGCCCHDEAVMVRRPPTRSSVLIAISLLVAFVVWTWLTFNSAALAAFDLRTAPPPLDPGSATAEIAAAFALLTWPGLEYAALAAIALVGVPAPTASARGGAGPGDRARLGRRPRCSRSLFQRPRPEQALDLLTAHRLRLSIRPHDRRGGSVDRRWSDFRGDPAERAGPDRSGRWARAAGTRRRLRSLDYRRALHHRHRGRRACTARSRQPSPCW